MMGDDGHDGHDESDKKDEDDDPDKHYSQKSDPYQNGMYSLHCYNLLVKIRVLPKIS